MAKCKDCIHYEPCWEYGNILDPIHGGVKCDSFKATADVVPRAEVDELKAENERLTDLVKELQGYNEAWVEDNGKLRKKNKNLAREIFEEIMSEIEHICLAVFLLAMTGENEEYPKGFADACGKVSDFIRELKKKYTEGGDQG